VTGKCVTAKLSLFKENTLWAFYSSCKRETKGKALNYYRQLIETFALVNCMATEIDL